MTVGIPGSGISYTEKIGSRQPSSGGRGCSGSGCLLACLAILGVGIVVSCFRHSPIGTTAIGLAIAAIWLGVKHQDATERRLAHEAHIARLTELYGEANVPLLLIGEPWIGCTAPMLVEMLGPPVTYDETVLPGKNKRTYKYRRLAKGRFGLKVFLENDVVCGWEEKGEQ
jgi:hypothetical protein